MMYVCEYCGTEATCASELIYCEKRCADEDRNTREWFKSYDPHRKD